MQFLFDSNTHKNCIKANALKHTQNNYGYELRTNLAQLRFFNELYFLSFAENICSFHFCRFCQPNQKIIITKSEMNKMKICKQNKMNTMSISDTKYKNIELCENVKMLKWRWRKSDYFFFFYSGTKLRHHAYVNYIFDKYLLIKRIVLVTEFMNINSLIFSIFAVK